MPAQSTPQGISAEVVSVETLFARGHFHPATVQREYQWSRPNFETLLSDLRGVLDVAAPAPAAELAEGAATGDDDDPLDAQLIPAMPADSAHAIATYYLGALILKPLPGGRFDVYDGLQRLTTLTILAAVLRDLTKTPALASRLEQLVLVDNGSPRLTLRNGAALLLEEVQAASEAGKIRRERYGLTDTELRLRAAARYFLFQLRTWPPDRIDQFAVGMLEKTCVGLTLVDDERIARQIFVATNLHGVRLNRVDLFKGQLMETAGSPAVVDQINAAWIKLENWIGADIEQFLLAVDFIERRRPQSIDCLTQLAVHLAAAHPGDKIVPWITDLERHAKAWIELHGKMQTLGTRPVDRDIWKLRFFWWPEWKPLALLWYSDYLSKCNASGRAPPQTWKAFGRRFAALHRRCLAIILADYTPGERALIFGKAITQSKQSHDPLNIALSFDAIAIAKMRQSLSVPLTDDEKRHATVRWIEANLWGELLPDHIASTTIEHVLPQRSDLASQWRVDFPADDERYDAAHSLGNLACLDFKRNKSLNNSDYAAKRAEYQRDPAYKTLQDVATHPVWTATEVRNREARLIDYVFTTMQLPAVARRR